MYSISQDGLVQDCSNSIANAPGLLQSCTKPSVCNLVLFYVFIMFVSRDRVFNFRPAFHHISCNGRVGRHSWSLADTVYPKKYAHGFCFAVLCCGYKLTDFPISIRLTSLALWQSNTVLSSDNVTRHTQKIIRSPVIITYAQSVQMPLIRRIANLWIV